MDILEAKNLVIKAGHELLKSGLIVRTWGNISCRVNENQFVITPSGLAYEDLTPEQIVLVNINDLAYEGDIKPSSEKGIHASCYELRKDANFVIHTHQVNASVVSALGYDINSLSEEAAKIIGSDVPCAAYGLPGTKKLRQGVINALNRSTSKAIVLAHHGAVCVGESYEDAYTVAETLEKVCEKYIADRCAEVSCKAVDTFTEVKDYIESVFKSEEKYKPAKEFKPCDSERIDGTFSIAEADKSPAVIDIASGAQVGGGEIPDSADLHLAIYKKRNDVNFIHHSKNEFVVAASRRNKKMKPLLDDFAQLIGPTVKTAVFDPNSTLKSAKKVVRALGNKNAVLLKDNGAICVAGTEYDAEAIEIVMDKGCKTLIGSKLYNDIKAINPIEANLMRIIYKAKYSKKAGK